jgi:hypothetical protein
MVLPIGLSAVSSLPAWSADSSPSPSAAQDQNLTYGVSGAVWLVGLVLVVVLIGVILLVRRRGEEERA